MRTSSLPSSTRPPKHSNKSTPSPFSRARHGSRPIRTYSPFPGTPADGPRKFKDLVYTNANKHHAIYLIRVSSEGTLEKVDEAQVEESMCHMALVADHSGLAIAHVSEDPTGSAPCGELLDGYG